MGKASMRSPRSPRTTGVMEWHKVSRAEVRAYGSYSEPCRNAMAGGTEELKDSVSLIL